MKTLTYDETRYVLVPLELDGKMWSAGRTAFCKQADAILRTEPYEMRSALTDRAAEKIFEAIVAARPKSELDAEPLCPECQTSMCDMREVTAPTYACCNPDCSQPKNDAEPVAPVDERAEFEKWHQTFDKYELDPAGRHDAYEGWLARSRLGAAK